MYVYSERNWDQYEPGDYLRVNRPGSLVHHDGIYYGDGYVIHADKGGIVEGVHLSEFAAGGAPQIIFRAGTWEERQAAVARAASRMGQPYDPLTANCEHLATFAQSGVAVSPTVRGFAGSAIFVGLLWAAKNWRVELSKM